MTPRSKEPLVPSRRAAHRRHTARRAYTVIEVLMAMTVMTIGGAAVMAMQKTSVTANLDARKTDVANAIARTWIERLERESAQWTLPSHDNPGGNNLIGVPVLGRVLAVPGQWFLPDQELAAAMGGGNGGAMVSPAFDILGRDVLPGDPSVAFCVHLRLQFVTNNGNFATGNQLIRADVRVIWPVGIANGLPNFCNAVTAADVDPNIDQGVARSPTADPNTPVFHSLYVTTPIRENPVPPGTP
jgi:hypothetical protein